MNAYNDTLASIQVWVNYGITWGETILTVGLYMAAGLAFFATLEFMISKR